MSKKRDFLRALARGDKHAVLKYMRDVERENDKDPRRGMGDGIRIVAFARDGKIKADGKEFSEASFKAYVRKIRSVENVHVTLFRTRPRTRPAG